MQQLHSEFQIQVPNQNNFIKTEPIAQDTSKDTVISASVELSDEEKLFLKANLTDIVFRSILSSSYPHARVEWDDIDDILRINSAALSGSQIRSFVGRAQQQSSEMVPRLDGPLNGQVTIGPDGLKSVTDPQLLQLIFSTYLPRKIGVIDFLSANRAFSRQQLGSINLNRSNISDSRKNNALYNTAQKYNQITQELAGTYIQMLFEREQGKEQDRSFGEEKSYLWESISELFNVFFPHKKFLGPRFNEEGALTFLVETSNGSTHDINELSSGEKEILMGYLRLYNSTPKNSVILLDEPELHLNPRLVRDLPDFYNEHIGKKFNNQIWFITHSEALLKQAVGNADYSVFHMEVPKRTATPVNQVYQLTSESNLENAIVDLVGEISQYSPESKVVFLEGENSEDDREMLSKLFPEFSGKVNLISVGSKANVHKVHDLLDLAAQQAGIESRFFSITDRDTDSVEEKRIPKSNRYTWDVYHIENYLLKPSFILNVVQNLGIDGIDQLDDHRKIENELQKIAETEVNRIVTHKLKLHVNAQINKLTTVNVDPRCPNPANKFAELIENKSGEFSRSAKDELGKSTLKAKEALHINPTKSSPCTKSEGTAQKVCCNMSAISHVRIIVKRCMRPKLV